MNTCRHLWMPKADKQTLRTSCTGDVGLELMKNCLCVFGVMS